MNPEPCERCRSKPPSTFFQGLYVCYGCKVDMLEEDEMAGKMGTRKMFDVANDDVSDLVPLLSRLTDDAFEILRSVEDQDVRMVFSISVTENPDPLAD